MHTHTFTPHVYMQGDTMDTQPSLMRRGGCGVGCGIGGETESLMHYACLHVRKVLVSGFRME